MRVNPILDWSYENIWKFILDFEIPYCSLYNEGYTHLGNKDNTVKNPFLKREGDQYAPAFEADGTTENYSRKSYKGPLEYLNSDLIIGVYDSPLEVSFLFLELLK